jgi:hypothetical protein
VAALLVLGVLSAHSQQSISVELIGEVPPRFNISYTIPKIQTIDLVHSNSARLGSIFVASNVKGVWSIHISSLHKGVLVGADPSNTDVYPYLLQFGDTNSIDLKNDYTVDKAIGAPNTVIEYDLIIWYTQVEQLVTFVAPDTYADTITITLSAV